MFFCHVPIRFIEVRTLGLTILGMILLEFGFGFSATETQHGARKKGLPEPLCLHHLSIGIFLLYMYIIVYTYWVSCEDGVLM